MKPDFIVRIPFELISVPGVQGVLDSADGSLSRATCSAQDDGSWWKLPDRPISCEALQ